MPPAATRTEPKRRLCNSPRSDLRPVRPSIPARTAGDSNQTWSPSTRKDRRKLALVFGAFILTGLITIPAIGYSKRQSSTNHLDGFTLGLFAASVVAGLITTAIIYAVFARKDPMSDPILTQRLAENRAALAKSTSSAFGRHRRHKRQTSLAQRHVRSSAGLDAAGRVSLSSSRHPENVRSVVYRRLACGALGILRVFRRTRRNKSRRLSGTLGSHRRLRIRPSSPAPKCN